MKFLFVFLFSQAAFAVSPCQSVRLDVTPTEVTLYEFGDHFTLHAVIKNAGKQNCEFYEMTCWDQNYTFSHKFVGFETVQACDKNVPNKNILKPGEEFAHDLKLKFTDPNSKVYQSTLSVLFKGADPGVSKGKKPKAPQILTLKSNQINLKFKSEK